ncbi:MAG: LCP family protein [Clostridia bacterium]|nr:LCP family protein [Clostridia bacterium]
MDNNFDDEYEIKVAGPGGAGGQYIAGGAPGGSGEAPRKKKKKKFPGWAIALIVIISLLLIIAAGALIFVNSTIDRYVDKINYTHDPYDPFDTAPIQIDTLPPGYDDEDDEETPGPTQVLPADPTPTLKPGETAAPTTVPTATVTPSPVPTSDVDDDAVLLMSDKVYNILLIGSDTRNIDQFRGNSDVIMLISLNSVKKEMWLTSFHRDSYVEIPGVGYNKINSAYARGGAKLLQRTLQDDFLVVAPYYCIINFDSFPKVIDAMGGVDITITKEEAEKGTVPGITEAGTYTLTGAQALLYARERHLAGDDWGRTQRHRNVVSAVFKKFRSQSLSDILSTIDVILPLITTNMPKNEIKSLTGKVAEFAQYSVKELSIPIKGTWHNAYLRKTTETIIIDSFWRNIVAIRDKVYAGVELG